MPSFLEKIKNSFSIEKEKETIKDYPADGDYKEKLKCIFKPENGYAQFCFLKEAITQLESDKAIFLIFASAFSRNPSRENFDFIDKHFLSDDSANAGGDYAKICKKNAIAATASEGRNRSNAVTESPRNIFAGVAPLRSQTYSKNYNLQPALNPYTEQVYALLISQLSGNQSNMFTKKFCDSYIEASNGKAYISSEPAQDTSKITAQAENLIKKILRKAIRNDPRNGNTTFFFHKKMFEFAYETDREEADLSW